MNLRKNLQDNLIKLLKFNNLSQKDFAEICNVRESAVSKWINGTQIPNVDLYDKICSYFKISLDQLFGRQPLDLQEG